MLTMSPSESLVLQRFFYNLYLIASLHLGEAQVTLVEERLRV